MTTEGFVKVPRTMLEWGWLDDGNVSLYELKFDNWAAKKGISDFSNMYGVIAKWLAEDKVSKPHESSFNMGDVMQNIISRYKP